MRDVWRWSGVGWNNTTKKTVYTRGLQIRQQFSPHGANKDSTWMETHVSPSLWDIETVISERYSSFSTDRQDSHQIYRDKCGLPDKWVSLLQTKAVYAAWSIKDHPVRSACPPKTWGQPFDNLKIKFSHIKQPLKHGYLYLWFPVQHSCFKTQMSNKLHGLIDHMKKLQQMRTQNILYNIFFFLLNKLYVAQIWNS